MTAKPQTPDVIDWDEVNLAHLSNIIFSHTEDGNLYADCFWDDSIKVPKPAIIWLHEGGFTSKNKTRKTRPESTFLELVKRGYFVASIDYRLAQTRKFPAALEDCKCAVRYFRKHADKYNINSEKIGVWGCSCGGQMAALMAVQGGIEEFEDKGDWQGISSDVQAAVSWYGGLSFKNFVDLRKDTFEEDDRGFSSFRERFEFVYGGTIEEKQDLIEKIDPMSYATRSLAPILAMISNSDNRIAEDVTKEFCQEASINGLDITYLPIPGQDNGYFQGEEYYEIMYAFFDRCLKH